MLEKVLVVAVVCAALGFVPDEAMAQGAGDRRSEDSQYEAFGSVSYLIADVGGAEALGEFNGVGFQGTITAYLNDWLGIGGEVGYNSGDFGGPLIQIFPIPEIEFTQWTVMFGPRFRLGGTDRLRVGAQALVGIARGSAEVNLSFDELISSLPGFRFLGRRLDLVAPLTVTPTDTVFGATFGVNFDLDINDDLVWRVVQPDILITSYGNDTQAHFRIASGLGIRF